MMGYWVSQVTATLAKLGVADHIGTGQRSSDELAKLTGANPDALFRVMRAGASVGLFTQVAPKTFKLTPVGDCLRKDAMGSMRDLLIAELAPGHWLPWGRLHDAVKTGQPTARATLGMEAWEYYAKNPEEAAHFARGMGNISTLASQEAVAAYDFTRFELVVDVGGSQGVLLATVLAQATKAKGILFDRPEVIAEGKATVAAYPTATRITSVGGDFFREVPSGGDLYLLKHILHDWDDARATEIIKNVRRAARPGAKLLLLEMVVPLDCPVPPMCLMDINMLVMLGGRERSEQEFRALLGGGGWKLERVIPTTGLFALLEATPA